MSACDLCRANLIQSGAKRRSPKGAGFISIRDAFEIHRLDTSLLYSNLYYMKATLDIPSDLYRRVKAKSAMEGRPIRAVAIQLFQRWLEGADSPEEKEQDQLPLSTIQKAPWLAITRPFVEGKRDHDLDAVRQSAHRALLAEEPARYGAQQDIE